MVLAESVSLENLFISGSVVYGSIKQVVLISKDLKCIK